jgi:hypothetical protein
MLAKPRHNLNGDYLSTELTVTLAIVIVQQVMIITDCPIQAIRVHQSGIEQALCYSALNHMSQCYSSGARVT